MTRAAKPILFCVALAAMALLGVGLYLQFVHEMLPCPLCVIQRYAFAAVALLCLAAVVLPVAASRGATALATLAALAGAGTAGWHLWVKAHPTISCGIDPLETSLNKIFIAEWLPFLFQADGLCSTPYDPILGLSIPQWSLLWFVVFVLVLAGGVLRRR